MLISYDFSPFHGGVGLINQYRVAKVNRLAWEMTVVAIVVGIGSIPVSSITSLCWRCLSTFLHQNKD